MELGAFSISLAVKDIETSQDFYKNVDFKVIGGDMSRNWLIIRNNNHTTGLFQGMFEKKTLTFNRGIATGQALPYDLNSTRGVFFMCKGL